MVKKSKEIAGWVKELLQKYTLHILIFGTASGGLLNGCLNARISLPEKVAAINKSDSIQGGDIKILNKKMEAIRKILELHDSQIANIQKSKTNIRPKLKHQLLKNNL